MRLAPTKGNRTFTAMVFQDRGWWVGDVEEVPGVNAQARTRKELVDNLHAALQDILELQWKEILAEVPSKHEEMILTV